MTNSSAKWRIVFQVWEDSPYVVEELKVPSFAKEGATPEWMYMYSFSQQSAAETYVQELISGPVVVAHFDKDGKRFV